MFTQVSISDSRPVVWEKSFPWENYIFLSPRAFKQIWCESRTDGIVRMKEGSMVFPVPE